MMPAPVTHILPLTRIRRARLLPYNGKVIARVGQQVHAMEVVAEASPRQKHLLLDIPAVLGIPRSKFSKEMISRKVGEKLAEGDVIAETRKLFKRVLRAPAASQILLITNGIVLLEILEDAVGLRAGFSGTVVDVIPERGVIIEATGALLQGIWGNGKINMGALVNLPTGASGLLTNDHLNISLRGAVGVAGCCRDKAALIKAAELPLHGLILGSMSAELMQAAQQIEMPVILLEGFGKTLINEKAHKILSTNEKRDVCIHAVPLDQHLGERPELLIPLSAEAEFPPEMVDFRPGQTVKILSAPHLSEVGTLEEVNDEPALLANGLRTKIATVRLENNKRVSIPFTNLEVLA